MEQARKRDCDFDSANPQERSYAAKIAPRFNEDGRYLIELFRRMIDTRGRPIPARRKTTPRVVQPGPTPASPARPLHYQPWRLLELSPHDWFARLKYGKSLLQLQQEMATSFEAHEQLSSINLLCARGRFGELRPADTRFKTDETHMFVFFVGNRYGLRELKAEEMADFFDDFCPCRREHDVESLRKQWQRLTTLGWVQGKPIKGKAIKDV